MTREKFEQLVSEALDGLPQEFATKLDNVEVTVEAWPTRQQLESTGIGPNQTLLGLYQGVPQTKRGSYTAALPDKITIFAGPVLAVHGNNIVAIRNQVRSTVLHEIAHHFGMSEEEIKKAQKK